MKLTPKPPLIRILPLPIHNLKCDILIRRPRMEPQNRKLPILRTRCQKILRRPVLVDQIRIENIKLVTLHDLRWRIVHVVVRLIVLVPLEARVHPVEITGFSRSVFVRPEVDLAVESRFDGELGLVLTHSFASLALEQEFFFCCDVLERNFWWKEPQICMFKLTSIFLPLPRTCILANSNLLLSSSSVTTIVPGST